MDRVHRSVAAVIAGLADTVVRANRRRNCVELGIPTGTVINHTSGIPDKNAGNPFPPPETSSTNTLSLAVMPGFLPKATLVVDHREIEITDAIASVNAQVAPNPCVSEAELNAAIHSRIHSRPTRTGATPPGAAPAYGIIDFIQGSVNHAKRYTRGIDHQLFHRTDSSLSFRLSGNHLFDRRNHDDIAWRNHDDIAPPTNHVRNEGFVALPRTRLSLTTERQPNGKLSLQRRADHQASQQLSNVNALGDSSDDHFDLFGRRFFVGVDHEFRRRPRPSGRDTGPGRKTGPFFFVRVLLRGAVSARRAPRRPAGP